MKMLKVFLSAMVLVFGFFNLSSTAADNIDVAAVLKPIPIAPEGIIREENPVVKIKDDGRKWHRIVVRENEGGEVIAAKVFDRIGNCKKDGFCYFTFPENKLDLYYDGFNWRANAINSKGIAGPYSRKVYFEFHPSSGVVSKMSLSHFGWEEVAGGYWGNSNSLATTPGIYNQETILAWDPDQFGTQVEMKVRMMRGGLENNPDANRVYFRGQFRDGKFYNGMVLQYANSGYVAVYEVDSQGVINVLRGWSKNPQVSPLWNDIKVIADDSYIQYWINGEIVWVGLQRSLAGKMGVGCWSNLYLYLDSVEISKNISTTSPAEFSPAHIEESVGWDMDRAPTW